MFVRKNRNRSGSVSLQIISKNFGKYKIVQSLGSSFDPDEVNRLVLEAKQAIFQSKDQLKLLPFKTKSDLVIESFVNKLKNSQIHTIGPELIFGTLFDRIGFNIITDELFRHLVVARLAYPTSKLKTVDYLFRYRGIKTNKDEVYGFLDSLNNKYKKTVEDISTNIPRTGLKLLLLYFMI